MCSILESYGWWVKAEDHEKRACSVWGFLRRVKATLRIGKYKLGGNWKNE